GHLASVNTVAFSHDGKVIASGSDVGWYKDPNRRSNLFLWNAETGALITGLDGHRGSVISVAFSPDGWQVISGSSDTKNNLILWNSDTFIHKILSGHTDAVNAVLFSKDGKKIISAGDGNRNNLCVWNGAGQLLYSLNGHNGPVKSIALNHYQN